MKKYIRVLILLVSFTFFYGCSSSNVQTQKMTFNHKPLHFLGLIPGANCNIQYQVNLFEDKTYFMRTVCFKDGVAGKNSDDIGTWGIDSKNRLQLLGTQETIRYFSLLSPEYIELMDTNGTKIDSKSNYKLQLSNTAKTIEPRVDLQGMFSYMADAALLKECTTGLKFPIVFKEDYLALEKAYLKEKTSPNESLKVYIDAQISLRETMDSSVKKPTIIVKKFHKLVPKEVCQHNGSKANLTNTYWKLTVLNDKALSKNATNTKEVHIILSDGNYKGYSGCNGMGGSYTVSEDKISLSNIGMATTMMFCEGSVEPEFLKTLTNIYRYELKGEYLKVFDKDDVQLAQFESVYLY